jgi:hypothetical protein
MMSENQFPDCRNSIQGTSGAQPLRSLRCTVGYRQFSESQSDLRVHTTSVLTLWTALNVPRVWIPGLFRSQLG